MAEFPALPIWTDAYLGDTRHLTAAQHGAYFLLLLTAWRTHDLGLPNNDNLLARWSAMSIKAWRSNKDVIMSFWDMCEDGKWRQAKLVDVRRKVMVNVDQKSSAGKASGLKRKERRERLLQRNGNGKVTNQNHNQNLLNIASSEAVFCDNDINAAKRGDPAWLPTSISGEILPGGWCDIAEERLIPDEQIYRSWGRFKERTAAPYQLDRWRAWVEGEKIN